MTHPKNRKTSLAALAISLAKAGIPIRVSQTVDGTTTVETLPAGTSVDVNEWDVVLNQEPVKVATVIQPILKSEKPKDKQPTKERVEEPIERPYCYTIPEIMALMRVGRSTVYKYLNSGELKRLRFGSLVRVSAESYEAFKQRHEVERL